MKISIAILLAMILLFINWNCQSKSSNEDYDPYYDSVAASKYAPVSYDSLMKYSYELLFLNKGKNAGEATGFFIENKNKLFLISNYHIFTCTNTITKEINPDNHDTLILRYKKIDSGTFFYDTISLIEIRKKNKPTFFYEYPDIYVYQYNKPKGALIHTVNSLIDSLPLKRFNPKNVISYGFAEQTVLPAGLTFKPISYIYQTAFPVTMPDKKFYFQILILFRQQLFPECPVLQFF